MLADWHATSPDLDVRPLAVVGRLLRCARHLEQSIVDALAPLGLSYGDFDVVNTLRRLDRPAGVNPRELATAALITSGAMTARLDRLADSGLVDRGADPGDRRGVLVTLTPAGRALADRALRTVLDVDERFLAPLDHPDRDTAAALLAHLLAPYDRR